MEEKDVSCLQRFVIRMLTLRLDDCLQREDDQSNDFLTWQA